MSIFSGYFPTISVILPFTFPLLDLYDQWSKHRHRLRKTCTVTLQPSVILASQVTEIFVRDDPNTDATNINEYWCPVRDRSNDAIRRKRNSPHAKISTSCVDMTEATYTITVIYAKGFQAGTNNKCSIFVIMEVYTIIRTFSKPLDVKIQIFQAWAIVTSKLWISSIYAHRQLCTLQKENKCVLDEYCVNCNKQWYSIKQN